MLEDAFVAEVKIDSCTKCPYCVSKIGFLHGDTDNSKLNCNVYICTKGAYGKEIKRHRFKKSAYYDGAPYPYGYIHPKCPMVNIDPLYGLTFMIRDHISNINKDTISKLLDFYGLEISKK